MAKLGRPPKLGTVDLEQVKKLASYGLTDEQISDVFNIPRKNLTQYKSKHLDFSSALNEGKDAWDGLIIKSLARRAMGYDKDGRHYPPEVTACIFWLKNRKPEEWRDTHVIENKFVIEVVGKLTDLLNKSLPDKCPHCKSLLSLRESTIKELEDLSKGLEFVRNGISTIKA